MTEAESDRDLRDKRFYKAWNLLSVLVEHANLTYSEDEDPERLSFDLFHRSDKLYAEIKISAPEVYRESWTRTYRVPAYRRSLTEPFALRIARDFHSIQAELEACVEPGPPTSHRP